MYPFRYYVDAGGLMAYGPSVADMAWRVASYVDKILKGAKPADLPVEQAMKFALVFNLEAARALGLTIPPMLLFQADDAICTPSSMAIPRPPEVNLTPPATDLPPEIAAFSGTWEGLWNGVLPSRLVVESIDAESARVVYAWADYSGQCLKGGWVRVRATVRPGGKLLWGSEQRFTFTMAEDRMHIEGEREEPAGGREISTVMMQKVQVQR